MSGPADAGTPAGAIFEDGEDREWSLLELVDHVLNKGVVVSGEATIAVADVDLIYLGLNVLLTSVETARTKLEARGIVGSLAARVEGPR